MTLPASCVVKIPDSLTLEEAATIPVAFLTAWYALRHLGRIRNGERVLIHAAAGGVGLAAVQVARLAGAEIFATAGSESKRGYLRSLGICHVMDSRTLGFADEIAELTGGRGVDLVLNSLAGDALLKGIDCLAPGGRFVEIGKRDIYQNAPIGLRPFRRNLSFFAMDLAAITAEQPDLVQAMFAEVVECFRKGDLKPLPFQTFPVSEAASAFHHMARARHIGKILLNLSDLPSSCSRKSGSIKDGSVLVVGGFSGFGLEVARWLISRGAGHLVLASRRGMDTDNAESILAELQCSGTRVTVIKADVSVEQDVQGLFEQIKMECPPLKGIMHSAMVIDDQTIAAQTPAAFRRVIAPKVDGAWNLHLYSRACPLEFFVMFSSVAALIGNPGQGSYAAANAFLDGLARYRHGLGLPGLAIQWGAISGAGYVSRDFHLQQSLEAGGLEGIASTEATLALGRLIDGDLPNAGVVRIDWQTAARRMPRLLAAAAFGEVVDALTELPESRAAAFFRMASDERVEAIAGELRDQLARILRTPADTVGIRTPLGDLGLDSLMSVELSNHIEQHTGHSLPANSVHPATTLLRIAETLSAMFVAGSTKSPEPQSVPLVHLDVASAPIVSDPEAAEPSSLPAISVKHRLEAALLHILIAALRGGSIASGHARLRRITLLLRLVLRQDLLWARQNLKLVFGPNLSGNERNRLAALAFENHLLSYVEGLRANEVVATFKNSGRLLEARNAGRGVILCGIHLGSWEPVLRTGPVSGIPIAGVYRRAHNPLSDLVFQDIRKAYGIEWVPSHDVTAITQCLKRNMVVGLMTDLNTVSGGIEADFLGVPAMCPAGPARLARVTGTVILPVVSIRTAPGEADVQFLPAIAPADPAETTRALNAAFEPWILEFAEQYNWLHPRWRTRPGGSTWDLNTSQEEFETARTCDFYVPSRRLRTLLRSV